MTTIDVRPNLVCAYGTFGRDNACQNRPTHVLFFERGDASTYCDEHGPNVGGPMCPVVLARAELSGVAP